MNLPYGWKQVKLYDVLDTLENGCRPKGGVNNIEEGIPSLGGEHLTSDGGFNFNNVKFIPVDFYHSLKRGKIQREDILVVKDGATTGKTSFVEEAFPHDESAVNEHVFILRGKKDIIHQKYLFYHLFSPIGQRQINVNFHGAAIGGINTKFVKNYSLVLPPFETQNKIVTVLEKAKQLKEWRKESDKLTDDYLKSVFLEMFGNPVKNKRWNIVKLNEIASNEKHAIVDGPFGASLKTYEYVERGIPVIRIDNIRLKGFLNDNFKYITTEKYNQLIRSKVKKNDILIARVGNTVGKSCIFNQDYKALLSTTGVCKITPNSKLIHYKFLHAQLNFKSYQKYILSKVQGAGQPYLNLTKIKNFEIILPPIELQNQFVQVVNQVEKMKDYQNHSKRRINDLFNVLMQKAFRGELNC